MQPKDPEARYCVIVCLFAPSLSFFMAILTSVFVHLDLRKLGGNLTTEAL